MNEISSLSKENRQFKPSKEFVANSRIKSLAHYKKIKAQADKNPEAFWAKEAKELHWQKPFKKTLEWKFPFVKWVL